MSYLRDVINPTAVQHTVDDATITTLLQRVSLLHRWMHVEKLEELEGKPGFTRAQGEE
ncbi:MAG: hypothetical protein SFX73_26405 [Kofleriaceae bacterium]|nr:hypothetical protein [Kofleriaceae bacterium]